MTCTSLLVALTVGHRNQAVLLAARRLSETFGARVIGVAACRPIEVVCPDYQLPAACFDADRRQIARQLDEAEREFRSVLADRADRMEWRAGTTLLPLAVHVAQQARSADLVVAPAAPPEAAPDPTREIDLADLVMLCGRHVLLVPPAAVPRFDRVLLAWKATREAERAAADALPFLAAAKSVTVVAIAAPDEHAAARASLDQIVDWLGRHGVSAAARLEIPVRGNAEQLDAIADQLEADLMVAGAYGHRRGQAWVLGGVTSAALAGGKRCRLLSH